MNLYIYKLKNCKNKLNNLPANIQIQNQNENQIRCSVELEDFSREIIIQKNSDFLFIIANKKSEKRKIFKLLYSHFKEDLSYFRPTPAEEHKFIYCNNIISLKFIHDNKIECNNDLTEQYYTKTLNRDYYFYEAKISLNSLTNNNNDYYLYYGDTIKIKKSLEDITPTIIDLFVEKWEEKCIILSNDDELLCFEIIDELLMKILNFLMEIENISENYQKEFFYFECIRSMLFDILKNNELSYLPYIRNLVSHLNDLIQSKSITPPNEYKIERDKFDSEFNKFEKKFYTEIDKSYDIFLKRWNKWLKHQKRNI